MYFQQLIALSAIWAIPGSLGAPWAPQRIVGQLRGFDQASCSAIRGGVTLDLFGAPGCRRLPGDWVAGSIQLEAQSSAHLTMHADLYSDTACREGKRRLLPGQCVDGLSDKVWRSYVVVASKTLELREEGEEDRTMSRRQEEEEKTALSGRLEEDERTMSRRREEKEE